MEAVVDETVVEGGCCGGGKMKRASLRKQAVQHQVKGRKCSTFKVSFFVGAPPQICIQSRKVNQNLKNE